MAYWNYRVKEELDKSYNFEDPIYKKKMSLVQYIKRFGADPIKLKEVSIKGMQMEDSEAWADLMIKIEVKARGVAKPLIAETKRKDRWGNISGIWYHVVGESRRQTGDGN